MLEYEKRYKTLNPAQKQAVDHIEGPLMVIAGPGTGKTELLSMRAANILRSTDMDAGNILCLTYTESGVRAMRERLIGLIGQDAYRVAIQTFHGFGSEVMSNNPDFFYRGADFSPADELSTYEILHKIFRNLAHNNPLNKKLGDEYTYMKKVQTSISDFKRAGLTPDEIQRAVRHSLGFIEYAEPIIQDFWPERIDKKIITNMDGLLDNLSQYTPEPTNVPNIEPLATVCLEQLRFATNEAQETQKTTAITKWKSTWLEKDSEGQFVMRDKKRLEILSASSSIYQEYMDAMYQAKLYDYDDMILRVAFGLDVNHELRLNIQEKYQYIMVDEFQDTNGAQMRILESLIQIPTGDAPNIMVVGDDDQAIYSFQGAEISNILNFKKHIPNLEIITLKHNYRSAENILAASRDIIVQGSERLETQIDSINKKLLANNAGTGKETFFIQYENQASEFLSVAENITQKIKAGTKPHNIAVLARGKKDILGFLPYLHHRNIKVSFEHDENILESATVDILLKLARVVCTIAKGNIQDIDEQLPEILAHPSFELTSRELWQISLDAYKKRENWLETMLTYENHISEIAEWLLDMAKTSAEVSVESSLDLLFGSQLGKNYTSPLKEYYFSEEKIRKNPGEYVSHLQSLSTIRSNIRQYKPLESLSLSDFVAYCDLAQSANIQLKNHYEAETIEGAVQVMTAHKSKGLEFEAVYILHANDDVWGSRSRGISNRLSYPTNMPLAIAGDSFDDKLRLFFVAMTRAKKYLYISSSEQNLSGKKSLKAEFLSNQQWRPAEPCNSKELQLKAAEHTWHTAVDINKDKKLHEILSTQLKNYQLSATHLNNFIDVTKGGPQGFLLNNILHFPQGMSASAAMGSSVHKALQNAHQHLRIEGDRRPIEDVVGDFEKYLRLARLPEHDYSQQLQKGSDALRFYLDNSYDLFDPDQDVEFDFTHQGSTSSEARITGVIDVMLVNKKDKTIEVVDYKTGKPSSTWNGSTDFEKIKLHRYKQQLMFYRLLIENSRDFKGYRVSKLTLDFIEPSSSKKTVSLDADFTQEELETFQQLITKVWSCIMNGDFIDTSDYPQTYKGVLEFEKDLLLMP